MVNCSTVKPFDDAFLSGIPEGTRIFTMEDHMITGGFGETLTRYCLDRGYTVPVHCFGVADRFIQHGDHELLMQDAGLNAEAVTDEMLLFLKGDKPIGR